MRRKYIKNNRELGDKYNRRSSFICTEKGGIMINEFGDEEIITYSFIFGNLFKMNPDVEIVMPDNSIKTVGFRDEFYSIYVKGYLNGRKWFEEYYSCNNYFIDSKKYAKQLIKLFRDGDERVRPILNGYNWLGRLADDRSIYLKGFEQAVQFKFENTIRNMAELKETIKGLIKTDLTDFNLSMIAPFSNERNFKLFKFLEAKWVGNSNKNRWTHLYEFIKEKEKSLNISEYNQFITDEYGIEFTAQLNYHAGFPSKREKELEEFENEFVIQEEQKKKITFS